MKKLFLVSLAVLLMGGVAWAISFPQSEKGDVGPYVWTVPVYNNSGSNMPAGTVAVWQITSSTGDDDNYVTTSTDVDTFLVAGVIYPNAIASTDTGTMAVHGVVTVLVGPDGVAEGSLLCVDNTTAGLANNCSSLTDDSNAFGFATTGVLTHGTYAEVKAFLFGR